MSKGTGDGLPLKKSEVTCANERFQLFRGYSDCPSETEEEQVTPND